MNWKHSVDSLCQGRYTDDCRRPRRLQDRCLQGEAVRTAREHVQVAMTYQTGADWHVKSVNVGSDVTGPADTAERRVSLTACKYAEQRGCLPRTLKLHQYCG